MTAVSAFCMAGLMSLLAAAPSQLPVIDDAAIADVSAFDDERGTAPPPEEPPTTQTGTASTEPAARSAPRTGWGVQGIPILVYNSDDGLGYGGRVMLVDHADGTWAPYRYAITAQFFQTTGGYENHRLILDAPRIFGSRWRLRADAAMLFERYLPYYGIGNTSEYVPAYERCSHDALRANPDVCPDNPEFRGRRYYAYQEQVLPRVWLTAQRDLGGPWSAFGAYRLLMTTVTPTYSRERLGQTRASRLVEDAQAGRITGYDGRDAAPVSLRTAELTIGLVFDTRDKEAAPRSGMYHELSVRGAAAPVGSEYAYGGITSTLRFYLPLLTGPRPLVAAARVFHDVMWGQVPFTAMRALGGLEFSENFGGVYTIRGLPKNRFSGAVKQIVNVELRWTPLTVTPFGQTMAFTLVAAADAGRVWTDLRLADAGGYTLTGVAGIRLAWNENFIIRLDYGRAFTTSSTGVYLGFGHLF